MMKRSNSLRRFFLVGLILIFGGCVLKQNPIEISHYSIDFKIKKFNTKTKLDAILIEEPIVNKSFNHTSIFYNTKPYLFEEYAKNRWINLPSNMIHNQLIDSFSFSKIFTNVTRDSKVEYKYRLKSELIKLYHTFENEKSYAVINIKFDLIDEKKVLKSYVFERKILANENSAYGFVKATNKGLKTILEEVLTSISNL